VRTGKSQFIDLGAALGRRQLLQRGLVLGAGLAGVALGGCGGSAAQPSPTAASPSGSGASAKPASSAVSAPASPSGASAKPAASAASVPASGAASGSPAVATSWDSMVAAAKSEGQVVVAGPPDTDTRNKLPAAFKQAFGIELQYLGQNSSQVATRMASERASNQYTLDVMLAGADTVYETLVAKGWLDPLKPALLMPGVNDAANWKTGKPWFRDSKQDTVLQLFNTVTATVTLNPQFVKATDIPTADALLDPKWTGKIGAFDPSANGIGLPVGAVLYISKGPDFATKLYKGQNVALTQDYKQVADWVAHGNYPIGIAVAQNYLLPYQNAGITFATPELSDAHSSVAGGFGLVCLINNAPHPNAARVLANWMAGKDGLTLFSQTQEQVPVRTDIDATWIPKGLIPQPGINYLDSYDPQFVLSTRAPIKAFYTKLLK